jgi:hypothetical protein
MMPCYRGARVGDIDDTLGSVYTGLISGMNIPRGGKGRLSHRELFHPDFSHDFKRKMDSELEWDLPVGESRITHSMT